MKQERTDNCSRWRQTAQPRSSPAVLRIVFALAVAAQAARLSADGDALPLARATDLHGKEEGR